MKIEELPHIAIRRVEIDYKKLSSFETIERRKLLLNKGYIPHFDAMSNCYSIISKLLDDDCVVAYVTDNSQTTFLIKTRRQYVSFISISDKLSSHLQSYSTRKITKIYEWKDNTFLKYVEGEDLIIADKKLWDKYMKIKILEKLEK